MTAVDPIHWRQKAQTTEILDTGANFSDCYVQWGREPKASDKAQAIRYLAAQRARDKHSPGLFVEPAWNILLDLFIALLDGKEITVSSACIAAACPATTALRHIYKLEKAGLITISNHQFDGRKRVTAISHSGVDVVTIFLNVSR